MLIAMFPANVYANHHLSLGGKPVTPIVPRTLLQIVFLARFSWRAGFHLKGNQLIIKEELNK